MHNVETQSLTALKGPLTCVTSTMTLVPVFLLPRTRTIENPNIDALNGCKIFRFYEIEKFSHHYTRTHEYFPQRKNRILCQGQFILVRWSRPFAL